MNLHDREESVALVKAALEVGKGRTILSKGDVPGHEFHGNQYGGVDDNGERAHVDTKGRAKKYEVKMQNRGNGHKQWTDKFFYGNKASAIGTAKHAAQVTGHGTKITVRDRSTNEILHEHSVKR